MIYSMTGYATQNLQFNESNITLEIKSVNQRFLDISIKAPEEFKALEILFRNKISQEINRGKIELRLFFKDNLNKNPNLKLNTTLLESHLKLISEINTFTKNNITYTLSDIINIPGILINENIDSTPTQDVLIDNLNQLVNELKESQLAEGEKLSIIMLDKLKSISKIIDKALLIIPELVNNYQLKIKNRITEALNQIELNDIRLQQEFAYFCQKADVIEELDRLKSHITESSKLLNSGGIIGKRLDFLCQEMHREANTFGAKSIAIETTHLALELKILIEQLREQVQNIM